MSNDSKNYINEAIVSFEQDISNLQNEIIKLENDLHALNDLNEKSINPYLGLEKILQKKHEIFLIKKRIDLLK